MSITERFAVVDVGMLAITPRASTQIQEDDLFDCFVRHLAGDWGEVDDEDRRANDMALETGRRILSAYTDRYGSSFWIITEADRSATTILLPGDY